MNWTPGHDYLLIFSWSEWYSRSGWERDSVDGTHMQPGANLVNLTTQIYTDTHREDLSLSWMFVCALLLQSVCVAWTYPVQSFGLYVPEELLPPVRGHLGGDVLWLLWYAGSHFYGVFRWFLGAGCQRIVRRHLLQQGCHGRASRHWTSLWMKWMWFY